MNTTRKTRAGLSLVEVLVAMFIMALGMIALLTLFPLGALQMTQAIKDERCAQAAYNADNIMRTHWKQYVTERIANGGTVDPFTNAFIAPRDASFGAVAPAKTALMPNLAATSIEQSYPVFVDPAGFNYRTQAQGKLWMAGPGGNAARIIRRPLGTTATNTSIVPSPVSADYHYRTTTLLDDLTFNDNGSADIRENDPAQSVLPIERQGRFTWAWMLQRPSSAVVNYADMTVLVYDNRKVNYPTTADEVVFAAIFIPGSQRVTINFAIGTNEPAIKAGGWILDGTQNMSGVGPNAIPVRIANFYRVTGVERVEINATTGQLILDLQTPIKSLPNVNGVTNVNAAYTGDLYLLRGLAEVFVRNPLTADSVNE